MGNQQGQELCREEEDIVRQGQRDVRPGIRPLLEEVGGYASGVATAMFCLFPFVGVRGATCGGDVILHAKHSVGMVMVGNNGHYQHP